MDHDFYSVESVGDDIIMAGTVYPNDELTNTDLHVQRMDGLGSIVWEMNYDIGTDERCLDIGLQGTDYILLTGSNAVNGHQRIFVVRIDQNTGAFIDMVYLTPPGQSIYDEQYGMEIIYSPSSDMYYVVGQGSSGLAPFVNWTEDASGLLFCLDQSLQLIWTKEINKLHQSGGITLTYLSSIAEVPGVGIAVSGEFYGPVCMLFDYAGTNLWSLDEYPVWGMKATKGLVYEPNTDRLYMNSSNGLRFHLIEVSSVSGGAFISNVVQYDNPNNDDFWPEDIHINYATDRINIFGFVAPVPHTDEQNRYSACVSVDASSLIAVDKIAFKVGNLGHHNHDYEYYSRKSATGTTAHPYKRGYTDQYTPWQDGYALIGYDYSYNGGLNSANNYNLVVYQTDEFARNGADCELENPITTKFVTHKDYALPDIFDLQYDAAPDNASPYDRPHEQFDDCPEILACGINVNSLNAIDAFGCSSFLFSANTTAASGTYITGYAWDWGDGTADTTYEDTASYAYSTTSGCSVVVCVTVFAIGPDGSECADQLCMPFDVCDALNVSTGYNESSSTLISNNTMDDDWIVTQVPAGVSSSFIGQNAYVIPKNASYDWAGSTSKYLNYRNNTSGVGNWAVSKLPYIYQLGFCICGESGQTYTTTFDLSFHSDNWGEVYLMDASGNPVQQLISQTYAVTGNNFKNPTDNSSTAPMNLPPGNYSLAIVHREHTGAAQGVSLDGIVNSTASALSCGFTPVLNGSFYGTTSFKDGSNGDLLEEGEDSGYMIYPNPANDQITVAGVKAGAELLILDAHGRVVLNRTLDGSNEIDISGLAKGMYYVKLQNASRSLAIQKLIIE